MGDDDKAASKSLAPHGISVFGPAPILEGEDAQAYNELLARVSGDIKAKGIIEEILVQDVVNLTWEILRWRRLKAARLSSSVVSALSKSLGRKMRRKSKETEKPIFGYIPTYIPPPSATKLAEKWAAGDPAAIDRVNKIMASANVKIDLVMANVLMDNLDTIERIDHLIAIAEARRNSILREIDHHRAALAENLRATVRDVEEAEFDIVKSTAVGVDEKAA